MYGKTCFFSWSARKTQTWQRTMRSCFLSSFVEFRSAVPEGKLKMSKVNDGRTDDGQRIITMSLWLRCTKTLKTFSRPPCLFFIFPLCLFLTLPPCLYHNWPPCFFPTYRRYVNELGTGRGRDRRINWKYLNTEQIQGVCGGQYVCRSRWFTAFFPLLP